MIAGHIIALPALDGMSLLAQAGQHGAGGVRLPASGLDKFGEGSAFVAVKKGQHCSRLGRTLDAGR